MENRSEDNRRSDGLAADRTTPDPASRVERSDPDENIVRPGSTEATTPTPAPDVNRPNVTRADIETPLAGTTTPPPTPSMRADADRPAYEPARTEVVRPDADRNVVGPNRTDTTRPDMQTPATASATNRAYEYGTDRPATGTAGSTVPPVTARTDADRTVVEPAATRTVDTDRTDVRPAIPVRRDGGSGMGWWIGGAVIAGLLLLVLIPVFAELFNWGEGVIPRYGIRGRRVETVPVADLVAQPASFVGRPIAVTGTVGDDEGRRAFILGDPALGAGVLVLSGSPLGPNAVVPGVPVQVEGTVRPFDLTQFQQELGMDLDPRVYGGFVGQPVVLAERVGPVAAGAAGGVAGAGAVAGAVRIDDIADNPRQFIGQTVTVTGDIGELIGRNAFTLEDEDMFFNEEIPVISRVALAGLPGLAGVNESARVTVTGVVRAFRVTDVERELGVDMDDALFADWAGDNRVVIVATSVQPAAAAGAANVQPGVAPAGNVPAGTAPGAAGQRAPVAPVAGR